KKYGEATAILVGDLLHSASFELLARAELPPLAICYFARAIGAQGMVSGQFLDIQAEITDVRKLHRLKTGRLIEAALVLPQWAQGKFPPRRVVHWARALGLLFQITDDLLDATGDSGLLGKTAGKDAAQQKKTFVALLGKEGAHSEAARLASQLQQEAETLFPNSMLLQQLPQQLLNRKS
ncbi:MAG: polyprenyl synthetase family protein, partial [Turneriella sp.]|nr:polyprenyl synthetase family protein [Turneriella sp.]